MTEVSVVIPTKNEEKQIKITLNHLLRQSFEDFEIIVSDGNSEDNTKNVVEEFIPKFRQRKINLSFVTTSKKGVSEGRNYGAKKARGKYIYFLMQMFIQQKTLSEIHFLNSRKKDFHLQQLNHREMIKN
tara:strand:- start:278 stop:664 length:387 start_codon:yes stop_codon:yes gene_type:complete